MKNKQLQGNISQYILDRTLAILQTIFNVQRILNIKGACVYVSAYLLVHYFIHLSVLLFACPFYASVCWSICLSVHPLVFLNVHLFICLFPCLLTYLSFACLLSYLSSSFHSSQLLEVLKSVHVSLSSSVVFTNEIFIVKQNEVA